jgi:hypothetical protein
MGKFGQPGADAGPLQMQLAPSDFMAGAEAERSLAEVKAAQAPQQMCRGQADAQSDRFLGDDDGDCCCLAVVAAVFCCFHAGASGD